MRRNTLAIAVGCFALTVLAVPLGLYAQRAGPDDGVWRNYDFVPGSRVIKVISLDSAAVGRFPGHAMRFGRGTMEVVEFEGKRWLQSTAASTLFIDLPEKTGREFSLEFLLRVPTTNLGARVFFRPRETGRLPADEEYLDLSARPGIHRAGRELSGVLMPQMVKHTVPVRFQVSGEYAILYVGSDRVAMIPVTNIPRSGTIEMQLAGNPRFPVFVRDVVVAVDLPDLGATLAAGKPFTTRGVLFDTDSDVLRAESAKALRDIVTALTRADTLHVIVEGHTDSAGDAAHNLDLSSRRAARVVEYLVQHGVERTRLKAVGKGEAEPVVPNDTHEHRQTNRRVVVVPVVGQAPR